MRLAAHMHMHACRPANVVVVSGGEASLFLFYFKNLIGVFWLNHTVYGLLEMTIKTPPPIPLFQLVRLGLEARGLNAAAREGKRFTKIKGGGGGRNPIL